MSTNAEVTQRDLRELVRKVAAKEKRILSLSIVFTLVAIVGGAVWLWYAYNRVQKLNQEYDSKFQQKDAQLKTKGIELEQKDKELAQKQSEYLKLEANRKQLEDSIKELNEYYAQLQGQLSKGNEQQSRQIVDNSLNANPKVEKLVPRVYIQIGSEEQRGRASKIQEQLQKHGYLAPGIENVKAKAPAFTYVKYFHESEKNESEQIVTLLQGIGVKVASSKYIPGFENSSKMRQRHYEIWFGSDF